MTEESKNQMLDAITPRMQFTRDTSPKIEEESDIETRFKQEVHNTAVRDHDGSIEAQQSKTDALFEDLTIQLNDYQRKLDYWHDLWKESDTKVKKQRLLIKLLFNLWRYAEADLEKYEDTCWQRFKRWCRKQWEADIYRPSGF